MIIDGKEIAKNIKEDLKVEFSKLSGKYKLAVVYAGDDKVSERYINKKKKLAEYIGVDVEVFKYKEDISEDDLLSAVSEISKDNSISGIIVQLPLPKHIEEKKILNSVSPEKDVDALGDNPSVLPPVVGAIKEILGRASVAPENKKIVIVGNGRLVGKPTASWLKGLDLDFDVVDENTPDISVYTKEADVIITGAGFPGLIKPEMIKEDVVLIDAGTSESGGKLLGDADPACADKCSAFTPVPGGVGPITVVMLFKNLLDLVRTCSRSRFES